MKILMTTDTVGGVWTYSVDLIRSLAPAGVRVALATMGGPPSPAQRRQVEALTNVELHESSFKLEWMDEPWADVRAADEWLLEIAAALKPDVVHLNGYCHGRLPFGVPVLMVGHSCVLSWWEAVKGEPAPPSWDRYRDEVRDGLRAADRVVAPSRAMQAALRKFYGPLPDSRVIVNGRDAARYTPAAKEPFILTAGRLWDEAKNVAALAGISDQLPWPVYIAGDTAPPSAASPSPGTPGENRGEGSAHPAMDQRGRSLTPGAEWSDAPGLRAHDSYPKTRSVGSLRIRRDESVHHLPLDASDALPEYRERRPEALGGLHCLGRLDEATLATWMSRAAVYALPAKYEPFGLSALEAALSGCALVLGDIPSLREVWGDAATFVAPDDPAALRSALVDLRDSPPKRRAMAARAAAMASFFTPQRMAASYLSAYRELTSRAPLLAAVPEACVSSSAETRASGTVAKKDSLNSDLPAVTQERTA